jgi:hypothetical protein
MASPRNISAKKSIVLVGVSLKGFTSKGITSKYIYKETNCLIVVTLKIPTTARICIASKGVTSLIYQQENVALQKVSPNKYIRKYCKYITSVP